MTVLKRLFYEEDGQGMVEYGLIIALIAVAVIVALGALGGGIKDIFENVNAKLGEETTSQYG
jgi:pilus assembly protein Flp/PilA